MVNIILSPSQQVANKCALGDSEEDHCFEIAKLTALLLKDYECNVLVVPKEINGTEAAVLQQVVEASNGFCNRNYKLPSFHLDIHTDAGYNGKGSSGFYISENGRQFISIIQKEIAKVTPWLDSGVTKRSLYVLKHTVAIAGLIELSFHDRRTEATHIHENMDLYALGLLNGLVSACGIVKKKVEIDKHYKNSVDLVVSRLKLNTAEHWYNHEDIYVKELIVRMANELYKLTSA